jgi:endonuclease III
MRRGASKQLRALVEEKGTLFSEELGIDVARQPFRWLLAAMLFGGRISARVAKHTYAAFARHGLLTPQAILDAGWEGLIPVMGEGGYARYDNIKSRYISGMCQTLIEQYDGRVEALHARARDAADLNTRLLAIKGIGRVTASIFLRELRGVWRKADPPLTDVELLAARVLGLTHAKQPATGLQALRRLWRRSPVRGRDFRHLEAALVREGLALRKRHRAGAR